MTSFFQSLLKKYSSNNRRLIMIVALLQVLLLCFIAGKREWIHQQGYTIYIPTAPVDPRDLFRGDYVQLEYDIAFPSNAIVQQFLDNNPDIRDQNPHKSKPHIVYLSLSMSQNGIAEAVALSLVKPTQGLFIKGRIKGGKWRRRQTSGLIEFGIEKYFVEQGTGLALEEKRGQRNEWQTAMEMEVALGSDGTAVIKGHQWADLGIRIEVTESPVNQTRNQSNQQNNNTQKTRRSPVVKVSLRNQSDSTIQLPIYSSDQFCDFQLIKNANITDTKLAKGYEIVDFANRQCDPLSSLTMDIKNLAPEDIHVMEVDFSEPQWYIKQEGKMIEIADINDNWEGLRWVYKPPTIAEHNNENLWQSTIKTAVFRPNGSID